VSTLYLPTVIERSSRGERSYDIFSRLLMDRIVFVGTEITDDVANVVIPQLLFLESDAPGKDVNLYINSPGGSVTAALAMYDTIQSMTSPVNTLCMGFAASAACFLLAGGRKGKRAALPHARIMMHQPSSGARGTAADIEIAAREVMFTRATINRLMARHTGQPVERIERDFDRDYYMSADEARAYGLIDHVVEARGELVEETKQEPLTA
jgi:ATP-dependent Clp protease protease subunit